MAGVIQRWFERVAAREGFPTEAVRAAFWQMTRRERRDAFLGEHVGQLWLSEHGASVDRNYPSVTWWLTCGRRPEED